MNKLQPKKSNIIELPSHQVQVLILHATIITSATNALMPQIPAHAAKNKFMIEENHIYR